MENAQQTSLRKAAYTLYYEWKYTAKEERNNALLPIHSISPSMSTFLPWTLCMHMCVVLGIEPRVTYVRQVLCHLATILALVIFGQFH